MIEEAFMSNPHADVHGYKAFNKDWTCLKRQYSCPGEFRSQNPPSLWNTGMHFCRRLDDVFRYYGYDLRKIHVAEVMAFGSVVFGENKCATDGLKIIKELTFGDILSKVELRTAKLIAALTDINLIQAGNNDRGRVIGYECDSDWWPGTRKIVMIDDIYMKGWAGNESTTYNLDRK